MSAHANVDLGTLTDIARDRSVEGRAKLFSLLALLLVSRWSSLKPGERQQLAELVALLWSRGEPADRQQLCADLAGRPDIPSVLVKLVSTASAKAHSSSMLRDLQPPSHLLPQEVEQPDDGNRPAASIPSDDLLRNSTMTDAASTALTEELADAAVEDLSVPRDNPHRLTHDLLLLALTNGDLARFEVMLAQLANVRAPLLRRLLRESGNESLAILARAIGLDAETFQQQWQNWRREEASLNPLAGLPNRDEGQRVATFFSALTEHQVERLVNPWRNDGERLFPVSKET